MKKEKIFPTLIILAAAMSLFGACTTTVNTDAAPSQAPSQPSSTEQAADSLPHSSPSDNEIQKLQLSDSLKRGCQRGRSAGGFGKVGLPVGEIAVDFTLKDTEGVTVSLSGLLSEKPVVMAFGSFT
jgi:hypothetical protein